MRGLPLTVGELRAALADVDDRSRVDLLDPIVVAELRGDTLELRIDEGHS